MRVLMISGDKNVTTPGTAAFARTELMRAQVDILEVVFMGRGSMWPKIPAGHFDVVTAQDPFWRGLFAWRVARRLKAKLNVQVHTDLSAQSFTRYVLAQIILRHGDSVRVVSEKIKKQVEKMGIRAPIAVLPIFVDLERFRGLLRTPHSKKMILWIGRLEVEKDPEEALAVFKSVRDAGIDASLVVLGKGSLEEELRLKSAYNLEYRNEIDFPGWRDPDEYLKMADVVLSTSKHESWGASIVEALAAGVPVVAPDVGVAREAGAIVVPRSELASAVLKVLKSGEEKGNLKLSMPNAQEYVTLWRKSLEI